MRRVAASEAALGLPPGSLGSPGSLPSGGGGGGGKMLEAAGDLTQQRPSVGGKSGVSSRRQQ